MTNQKPCKKIDLVDGFLMLCYGEELVEFRLCVEPPSDAPQYETCVAAYISKHNLDELADIIRDDEMGP